MLRKFRTVIFAILTVTLMGSSLALASSTKEARSFALQGKVTAINLKERTMSLKEMKTGKEYLVVVPERAAFRITFGKDSKRMLPELDNVSVGDIVRCNVHLAGDEEESVAKRAIKVTVTKS